MGKNLKRERENKKGKGKKERKKSENFFGGEKGILGFKIQGSERPRAAPAGGTRPKIQIFPPKKLRILIYSPKFSFLPQKTQNTLFFPPKKITKIPIFPHKKSHFSSPKCLFFQRFHPKIPPENRNFLGFVGAQD